MEAIWQGDGMRKLLWPWLVAVWYVTSVSVFVLVIVWAANYDPRFGWFFACGAGLFGHVAILAREMAAKQRALNTARKETK
jgi:hypothetical protein